MNHKLALTITTLLSMLLFVVHWAEDVVRGFAPGAGPTSLVAVAILAVWLYATLALAGRWTGYLMTLAGSAGALTVLALHTSGPGMAGGRIVNSSGILFWVFTITALGATGAFSAILAAHGLWNLRRAR